MPLMKGKSREAFGENVKNEIASGKPQSQALAIAYGIRRRNKKMAKGGEVNSPNWKAKGWTHDKDYNEGVHREVSSGGKSYMGELVRKGFEDRAIDRQKSQMAHNKMVPKPNIEGLYEGGEIQEVMDEADEHLSPFAQEHEDIDEPEEPKEIYVAKEFNANKYRQMAKGGMMHPQHIVRGIMAKKMEGGGPVLDSDKVQGFIKGFSGVKNYAQGGELEPEYDYLDENDSYPDPDDEEFDAVSPDSKEYRKRMIKGIFQKR